MKKEKVKIKNYIMMTTTTTTTATTTILQLSGFYPGLPR